MNEVKGFEGWALVEVMGHHKFAGKVTEATIAGAGFLRLDVPESVGQQAFTKFISPAALYALTPVSEDVARGLAASYRVQLRVCTARSAASLSGRGYRSTTFATGRGCGSTR